MTDDRRTRRSTLAVACFGAFVSALSTSLVAVSAPVIARDLGVTQATASWVLSAYLLSVSCLLAAAGRAADLLGRKRVYLTGFSVFVLASAACAAAGTFGVLVAARVVQGAGASMLMAVGPALVTRSFPPEQRARGLGIQLAATYLGLTLGPTVGGAVATAIGWNAVFGVVAAAATAGGLAALAWLPRDEASSTTPLGALDLRGAALLAIALAALLVGLRRGPADGWASPVVLGLAATGALALAAFARNEARHPSPLLPLALLRSPPFAFGVAGATVLYVVLFMLSFLLPFHLQQARGMTAAQAGAIMTAQPAAMAVVAPLSGLVADRAGARLPSTAGMGAIAIGLALVAWGTDAGDARLAASLAVMGIGAGLFVAPNNAVIMGAAPRERQSTAAAIAATARNVGMMTGIAIAATLQIALGFRGSILVAAALAALGAAFGLARPAPRAP